MTKDIVVKNKDREEKAVIFHNEIIESVKGVNRNMRMIIVSAKMIRDNNFYIELGYSSFSQYLASPEISVKESTMEKYIKIYDETVGKKKLTDVEFEKVPISKLELISSLKNPHGWIDSARELSYTDLRKKIYEKVHGIEEDEVDAYDKRVKAQEKFCPNWNAKTCKCFAGIDIKKPIIEGKAVEIKK